VLEAAEGVADPMVAAVAHDEDALDAERVAAERAAAEGVVGPRRRRRSGRSPTRDRG